MPPMDMAPTFRARFEDAARRYADRPALRDAERVLSYAELDRRQCSIGAALAARTEPGEAVGVVVTGLG